MSPKPFVDAELGELVRRRRLWRGELRVGEAILPLAVPGGRGGPDPDALVTARSIAGSYESWQPALARMLAEHHPEPVAVDSVIVPQPVYAAVITLDDQLTVELGYRVEWDEEHTLGARFRGTEAVELCGAVLEP